MVRYLDDKTLSAAAQGVLNAGRTLWRAYFAATDVYGVREELKLNRPDAGWYQIRNALKTPRGRQRPGRGGFRGVRGDV